jgi:hypothetical protein
MRYGKLIWNKFMAWNPSPKVADCRDIARKWGKEQIIIIGIDDRGVMEIATYGKDKTMCGCAKKLGDIAFDAIWRRISTLGAYSDLTSTAPTAMLKNSNHYE